MDIDLMTAWLKNTAEAAKNGGHTWPEYAACEAALESNFGTSLLARKGNNLFGQKFRQGCPYGELDLPTKEFINGEWITVTAHWIAYPNLATCFDDRMSTLARLRNRYPHYNQALTATDGVTFVREVSITWSTDPHRADKVLHIYDEFFGAS